jgi:Tol biopolymer transport system component
MKKTRALYLQHYLGCVFLPVLLLGVIGCNGPGIPEDGRIDKVNREALIFPDYTNITIPVNIAALNFEIREDGDSFVALMEGANGTVLKLKSKGNIIRIPSRKWTRFLEGNHGSQFTVKVFKKENKKCLEYAPFRMQVAPEAIDPYLVYRLIPPGYETWSSMGLYERDLTSFREKPVIENRYVEDNCLNCHSFRNGDSEHMLFHIRGSLGGTMIKQGENLEKVNLKGDGTLSSGVYPAWHPSGKYIAFSNNKIEQYFHADSEKSIEVLDRHSDLIIYNTATGKISHVPGTKGDSYMETYPGWSPDGLYLYFSRTDANETTPFDSIRYDIYRVSFDPERLTFGDTEVVYMASDQEKSASFPRISPDGRYLLCTLHDYGTFPIWHKEADLCLVDLLSGESVVPEKANSEDTDSYHSWAQNSRWIVFSSRRFDGRYTKLYLSYLNSKGEFQKAFLLPQRKPGFYDSFFYSYNRPELITSSIQVKQRRWIRRAREK